MEDDSAVRPAVAMPCSGRGRTCSSERIGTVRVNRMLPVYSTHQGEAREVLAAAASQGIPLLAASQPYAEEASRRFAT